MILVKVPANKETELIQEFINTSAFTFEGIEIHDKKGMKELEKVLRDTGFSEKDCIGYWFTGDVMNIHFGLTGDNAYPDDLTFLVIPNYYNPMVKMAVGARWFDDIVANNTIRQHALETGLEPDYE